MSIIGLEELRKNLRPGKIYSFKDAIYEEDLLDLGICVCLPLMLETMRKYGSCPIPDSEFYVFNFDNGQKIYYTYNREIEEYTIELKEE